MWTQYQFYHLAWGCVLLRVIMNAVLIGELEMTVLYRGLGFNPTLVQVDKIALTKVGYYSIPRNYRLYRIYKPV